MAVEQAVDEMQVAGATASGAHCEAAAEMRLGAGREGRDLLVTDVKPFDLSLTADRIGQPVQAIADDSVDPFHTRCDEGLRELVRDGLHERAPLSSRWSGNHDKYGYLTCLAHDPDRRSGPWRSCRPKGRGQRVPHRYERERGCAEPVAPT